MNIYVVGLRRSGTTIMSDVIHEDERIKMYYEPFNYGGSAKGGGSMAKAVDYNERIREVRRDFLKKEQMDFMTVNFNLGAPSNFMLESEQFGLPKFHEEYLRYMLNNESDTCLKFVRATFLIRQLYEMDQSSIMIHMLKNPFRFAVSHIMGSKKSKSGTLRSLKGVKEFLSGGSLDVQDRTEPDIFFNVERNFNNWSQEDVSNYLIKYVDKDDDLLRKPAYYKLLYLWKRFNSIMESDGRKYFGSNYIPVDLDLFCNDPVGYIEIMYNKINRKVPDNVRQWAIKNVKPQSAFFACNDHRWAEAANDLGIDYNKWGR